ncbi:glycosyltransferase family 2 protein [Dyella sp.]|jgi:glycosyltransferase involved in cell wall biosynthesis|uniref:glycosyltransferase family 2 protein n=1 Tax=Dyella sp. TaxID=1869338 RepID=UPI002D79A4B3|nr:glycosyltransferase family 2 protein [Dyella sp.]HET6430610.1 glycosyltransferase family 2 protein [Dyella sp.]
MRISVAVITYNWPQALQLVLRALARQTELPFEVIVTDDGSREDTRTMLLQLAQDYPTRLVHLWQPDDGARMSRARNRAIAAAQGDYVILLDGDMVAERHFVADHRVFARPGCFVQGSRVLTDQALTARMLAHQRTSLGFFERGIERRRHTLRVPALAQLYAHAGHRQRGIKSCNMGFWRDDLLRLNGFNEAMTGWGREDTELVARAFHAGLLRRDVRFSALAFHLYHLTRKQLVDNPNDRILAATRQARSVRCIDGVAQHLTEFPRPPAALAAGTAELQQRP